MSDTTIPAGTGSAGLTLHDGDNLSVFGTVTSTTVSSGGYENVSSGGVASFTTISSGGFEALTGGTAISTTVDNGGNETVYSGGVASGTILSSGGVQIVSSGGESISATADGGGGFFGAGITVLSGGTATGATLQDGGYLAAGGNGGSSGGDATGTIVESGGLAVAYSGGMLAGTTVDSGGFIRVTGGTASATTISGGGGEAEAGGAIIGTTIVAGGYLNIYSGGSATSTTVGDNGFSVTAGGAATSTTIVSGGFAQISGGIATGTIILSGGGAIVYVGGTAISTTLSGGSQNVFSGGAASFTTISAGTEAVGTGGTSISATVSGFGYVALSAGGVPTGDFVLVGGYQQVSGGRASATTVDNYGDQAVSSGGTAVIATLNSGGVQTVGIGGTAYFTTVNSGGYQLVTAGGSAGFTLISGGGYQLVATGGIASATTVSGGITILSSSGGTIFYASDPGYQQVSGGFASNTILNGGGVYDAATETVTAGGIASGGLVEAGGFLTVNGGGSAAGTTIDSGGFAAVSSGGLLIGATVSSGGTVIVSSGGTARFTTISAGGSAAVSSGGTASSAIVSSGGFQIVSSGGVAVSASIDGGGNQIVSSGGFASATTVSTDGNQVVSSGGTAGATTIGDGGTETVLAGGSARFATVSGGGFQYAYAGGVTISTTVREGGRENVNGGTASATIVSSGGSENIGSGGTASATTVSFGGAEVVGTSGISLSATLDSGGTQVVGQGGIALDASVGGGGLQVVSGGLASATVVQSAGAEFVYANGLGAGATINSGGGEFVFSGGSAGPTTISGGGFLVVLPGGSPGVAAGAGETVSTGIVVWSPNSGVSAYGDSASGLVISDGDIAFVLPGGSAVSAVVSGDATLNLYLGGTVMAATIGDGGVLNVSSGGTANATTVDGGVETVFSGSTVSGIAVANGGVDNVSSGGIAQGVVVGSGGTEQVLGGTADGTTVSAFGSQAIHSGGVASQATVASGGTQIAYAGGSAVSASIASGGVQALSGGSAAFTTVGEGGTEAVFSGGTAGFTTVSSGGAVLVFPGGTLNGTAGAGLVVSTGVLVFEPGSGFAAYGAVASGIVVGSGGAEYVLTNGTAVSGSVYVGGDLTLYSGGTANATILAGASATVLSGGSLIATTVGGGGAVIVSGGGSASFTNVSGGGITVLNGATAVSGTIFVGGSQTVSTGGTASATVVSGGTEVVYSGGTATGTTVVSGGVQTLSAGTAVSAVVGNSGTEIISSGGSAIATTVGSGGIEIVSAGGQASFTTVSSGGTLLFPITTAFGDTTIDGDWTIGSGATVTIGAGTTTDVGRAGGSHAPVLTVDRGAALTIDGKLTMSGGVIDNGGTVTLLGTIDGAVVSGGVVVIADPAMVTLNNAAIAGNAAFASPLTLLLTGDDRFENGTIDLHGGTLDVTGTLDVRDAVLRDGTLRLEGAAVFNPGIGAVLDNVAIIAPTPASSLTTLSGQTVTLGTGYLFAAGDTIQAATGENGGGGASGTPGTFVMGSTDFLIGAGLVSVTDANGPSSSVINGLLLANVAGQSLVLDSDSVNLNGGTAEAANGGTLVLGDTSAAVPASTTLFGGNYIVESNSTVQVNTLSSITAIGDEVTLDGPGSDLEANAGGSGVPLEQSLLSVGGGSVSDGSAFLGTLNLLDGRDFTATNSLTLTGSITLGDATLTAPTITGQVYLPSGGGASFATLPVIEGSGTINAALAGFIEIIANGGALDVTGAMLGHGNLEALDNSSLAIAQPLPPENISAETGYALTVGNNATAVTHGTVAPYEITFAGTNSVVDLVGAIGQTVSVAGTLTGGTIDLVGVAAAVQAGLPEIQVFVKSPTLAQVTITPASAPGSLDVFNITGDFINSGVTAGSDGNGGTEIEFNTGSAQAVPVVKAGNGLTQLNSLTFSFGAIHQRQTGQAYASGQLLILNASNSNPAQGDLSSLNPYSVGGLSLFGGFSGLAPGQDTNSLTSAQGAPISLVINNDTAGVAWTYAYLNFLSTAPNGSLASGQGVTVLQGQSFYVTDTVWAYAYPYFPTQSFYVRATTTPGVQKLDLPIWNYTFAYSEGLQATIVGSIGDFDDVAAPAPAGSTPLLAAYTSDNHSLVFYADTDINDFSGGRGTVQNGTFAIAETSSGAGTSGLGLTNLGTVQVPVSVHFTQLASAYVQAPETFYIPAGYSSYPLAITVYNTAQAGVSEGLLATVLSYTGAFSFVTSQGYAEQTVDIAAGGADYSSIAYNATNNPSALANGIASVQTGTVTLGLVSDAAGVDSSPNASLGTIAVPITVYFDGLAMPKITTTYQARETAPSATPSTTTLSMLIYNAATSVPSESLIASLQSSTGDFNTGTNPNITVNPAGTTPYILPGAYNYSAISFQVVTDAAVVQASGNASETGTFTLALSSYYGPGYNYALPTQTLPITVTFSGFASPVIDGFADPINNPYNPTPGQALFETVNLGIIVYGGYLDHHVEFQNVAAAPADDLEVDNNDGTTLIGPTASVAPLTPGQSYDWNGIMVQGLTLGPGVDNVQWNPVSYSPYYWYYAPVKLTPIIISYTYFVAYPVAPANAWGDVHLTTFDGVTYNFQAEGEFVLAKSTQANNSFQIQVRLEPPAGAQVTLITDIGLRIGTDVVSFEPGRTPLMYVNGVASAISSNNAVIHLSGGTVTLIGGTYQVAWTTGESLAVTSGGTYLNIYNLTLGANDGANSVQGLLGSANGSGDFQLSDGTVLPTVNGQISQTDLYGVFANSWRVTQATSLLDYTNGQTTAGFTDVNFPADAVSLTDLPASVQSAALAAAAAAGITNPAVQQQAALDYVLTGSSDFLASGANAQQQNGNVTAAGVTETAPIVPLMGVYAVVTSETMAATDTTPLTFTAYLTSASSSDTEVDYAVTVPGMGYLGAAAFGGALPSGSVLIQAGDTTAPIVISVPLDALGSDPADSVQITISTPGGNKIIAASAETALINSSPVAGSVAIAQLALRSGDGTPVQNGATLTLALGNIVQGESISPLEFQIGNGAVAPADDLGGTLSDQQLPAFTMQGTASLTPLAPGQIYQGLLVALNTATIGVGTDTIVYNPTDENETGYSAALPAQSIVLSDTIIAPAVAKLNSPGTITFAPVHVNGSVTPAVLSVSNTAAAGSASLDASLGISTGGFNASGTISLLAPGATDSTSLSIAEPSGTAGPYSGFATISYTSDAGDGNTFTAGSGTIGLSGSVYRLAQPGTLAPIYLHVGASGTIALPVSNLDPADGYSEYLTGSVAGSTDGIITNFGIGEVGPGGTSSELMLTVPTTTGSDGTVTLDLVSDGGGTDNLGTTDLGDAVQSVFVDNYATAAFGEISGSVVSSSVNLGSFLVGTSAAPVVLDVLNAATGVADVLSGTFQTSGGSFINNGLTAFSGLAAGQTDTAPSISISTAQTGTFSESITLLASGSNGGGYLGTLTPEVVTVTGTVIPAGRTLAWTGNTDSGFGNALNWDDTTLEFDPASAAPDATDTVEFNQSGGGISGTGTVAVLDVGSDGSGGLQVNTGATLTAGSFDAGIADGAVSQVGVTGPNAAILVTGSATVADDGTSVLNVLSGATFAAGDLTIGAQADSSGAVVVSGDGSVINIAGELNVGTALGTGDLTIGPGAVVNAEVVNLQGQVVLENGELDPTVNLINQGQTAGGSGTIAAGDIVDEGVIQAGGSKPSQKLLVVNGTVLGGGPWTINGTAQAQANGGAGILQINAGGTLELNGAVLNAASTTFTDDVTPQSTYTVTNSVVDVNFADATGVLKLDQVAGFAGTIAAFQKGDSFVITGGTLSGLGVTNGNTLTVSDSGHGGTDSLIFASSVSAAGFSIVNNNTIQVACFAAGTRIDVENGCVSVEDLRVGDRVVTADGRIEPIVWVGQRTVNCARHPTPETVWPIRVARGAFGENGPVRDLYLSPDHAVFVNGVLVPVKLLVNGTSIEQMKRSTVTYHHVELRRHEVILAEGLAVESYLDLGDRANFDGGPTIRLFPDLAARLATETALMWETKGAAPLVMAGEKLEAARAAAANHALARPEPSKRTSPACAA